jgi:hypothetical protein
MIVRWSFAFKDNSSMLKVIFFQNEQTFGYHENISMILILKTKKSVGVLKMAL